MRKKKTKNQTKTPAKSKQKTPKILLVNVRNPCLQYRLPIPSQRGQHSLFVTCMLSELPHFLKKMKLNTRSRDLAKVLKQFGGNSTEKTLKSEQLVQWVVNWIPHPAVEDSASLISLHHRLYWKPSGLPGGEYRFCLIFVSWWEMEISGTQRKYLVSYSHADEFPNSVSCKTGVSNILSPVFCLLLSSGFIPTPVRHWCSEGNTN